jgi:hypothetical protein
MEGKMSEDKIKFKKGDWIIATRSILKPSMSMTSMFGGSERDSAYMHKPIKIYGITEGHVVYEGATIGGDKKQFIIPMEEIKERGFIIADKMLVDITEAV